MRRSIAWPPPPRPRPRATRPSSGPAARATARLTARSSTPPPPPSPRSWKAPACRSTPCLPASSTVESPADDPALAVPLRRAAARVRADAALFPSFARRRARGDARAPARGSSLRGRERMLGRLAAAHLGIAVRFASADLGDRADERSAALELIGDALAAGADEAETAEQIVRLAVELTGATSAALWRVETDAAPSLLVRHGNGELSGAAAATDGLVERYASAAWSSRAPSRRSRSANRRREPCSSTSPRARRRRKSSTCSRHSSHGRLSLFDGAAAPV